MNRSFVLTGMILLAAGFMLFWYTLYEGQLSLTNELWIWAWGITGTLGLALTIFGVIAGRNPAAKMPARFCVHCGRSIGSNEKICPYCKHATNPSPPPSVDTERQEDGSLARRLGKMFGKLEGEG